MVDIMSILFHCPEISNINENNEKIINNEHEISKLIKVKYQIIKYHQILFPIIIAFQININSK